MPGVQELALYAILFLALLLYWAFAGHGEEINRKVPAETWLSNQQVQQPTFVGRESVAIVWGEEAALWFCVLVTCLAIPSLKIF